MDKFQEYVLPYIENSEIKYLADGEVKAMSVDYFQKSFISIAAKELPGSGQCYYYYQHLEHPELVMCFRLSQSIGLSATIMRYSDYEKQLSELGLL